ncbi:MAG: hypothetical protein JSU65_11655 [Candidatus Zixiibacteriota bacterium]|nr:MAG: hypothetical protein JSU65_11655 [candidate division Zixibacteria bacterium]
MAYRQTKRRTRRAVSRRPATRRVRTRRATNGGNQWSREEIAFMRKFYRNHSTAWIARQLGRTVYSVRYKASDLCIKKANPSAWKDNPSTKFTRKYKTSSKKSWGSSTRRTTRNIRSRKNTRRASSRRTIRRRRR